MEGNTLKGIVTDGDLKRHMAPDLLQQPASTIMTRTPKTIEESALAVEAMNVMTKTEGRYLTSLVVHCGRIFQHHTADMQEKRTYMGYVTQALQYIDQIFIGIDLVKSAGHDQALHDPDVFGP